MPLLDVTDVLSDPDFVDNTLVCFRSVETVDDRGRSTLQTTATPFAGVVTSDRGDILDRIAEGERITGSILICTTFRLTDGKADGTTADEVEWQGRRYTVAAVNDYSTYGAGFVEAVCDLKPLSG